MSLRFYLLLISLIAGNFTVGADLLNDGNLTDRISFTEVNEYEYSLSCNTTSLDIQPVEIDGRFFQQIAVPSEILVGSTGGPALPAWSKWVKIPNGMKPTLNVKTGEIEIVHDIDIAPLQVSPPDNPAVNPLRLTAFSAEAYLQDEFSPSEPATISQAINIGSSRWAVLTVTPFRYNPARRELHISNQLDVEVIFTQDPDVAPERSRPVAPAMYELERSLSDNPAQRDEFNNRIDNLGSYVIIIGDDEDALEAIEPLVEWKIRKGFIVTVANLGDIGDERGDIRSYLIEAYEEWDVPPSFVLLAGDCNSEDRDLRIPTYMAGGAVGSSWHASDNHYVRWDGEAEGNNPQSWTPNGFIGRLPADDVEELQQMVVKILNYEVNPYMDDPWIEGAMLISHGVQSCIHVQWAVRELMTGYGYSRDNIHEELANWHGGQPPNVGNIERAINNGVGFINFRGYNNWGNFYQANIRNLRNSWMMPVVTGMVCATNDFTQTFGSDAIPECRGEAFIRDWRDNEGTGGVACFGPTDLYTHTWFNNTMSGEFYNSLFTKNVSYLGALCTASKLSLVRNYPSSLTLGNGTSVGCYFYTYTLLGDPGLQVRTREPLAIDADYPPRLPVGATYIDLFVFDEDENPVPDAYVHIYLDDDVRYGAFTDEEGFVEFEVDPLPEGVYKVTISGQNLIPILGEITVSQAEIYLSLDEVGFDDDGEDDSEGNDDGLPNPGETIELNLTLSNTGSESCQGATASIRTESPWVEIIRGEADYNELDVDETGVGDQPFILNLTPETPDGEEIVFELSIDTNEKTWDISFGFAIIGYNLAVREHFFMDGLLYPGEEQQLLVNIENRGQLDTEELTAILSCDMPTIQIRDEETTYFPIASGDHEENIDHPFLVFASPFAYQGSEVEFHLALTDENGLHDELSFTVLLGEPTVTSPQGPDGYGYWAFDNRDTTSGMAPEYDWIEGRDRLQGLYDPNDTGPLSDHGSKTYVDLPFDNPFVYYGQEYDEITVGTNGWLCFGRTAQIAWQNQEMGASLAPAAMVAPFWNDLHSGEVYTRYDEDEGRFVIEWRDWGIVTGGSATFEVILYDPRTVPTITGDGEIVFQYEDIPNLGPRDYPSEKATIGISSPDRQNFIQITHAGNWDPRTADLGDEAVIRFSTGEFSELGSVEGRVADIYDNWPMADARVMIDGTGFFDNSDERGNYRIDGIPIGTYNVIARMRYYNDAVSRDIEIIQDEAQEVNFELTHPRFNINIESIEFELRPDYSGGVSFDVWNTGNGPLDYDIKIDYEYEPPEERDDPWDMLFEFNLSDTSRTGDYFLKGVEFDGENLFIAGKHDNPRPPHKIYVLNRAGEMIRQFDQHAVDSSNRNGYYELTWNGENMLAVDTYDIVEITREGEPVDTIPNPVDRAHSIAWSPERGTIFTKGISDYDILEINTDGEDISSFDVSELTGESQRFYGLAWFPEDPQGFKLYMFVSNDLNDGEPLLRLMKLNVETGEFIHVQYFDFDPNDKPEGCTITKLWNPLIWTFIGLISNSDGDRVFGVELGPNLTWIDIVPAKESVPADELQTISVSFFARDMPEREYDIQLKIYHNAVGDRCNIPVHFIVDRYSGSGEHDEIPNEFHCDPPSPNPFNSATRLSFSLPVSSPVELILYDISGRKVNQVDFGLMAAGQHTITIDGSSLSSGVYLARLKAGSISATQKMVLLR